MLSIGRFGIPVLAIKLSILLRTSSKHKNSWLAKSASNQESLVGLALAVMLIIREKNAFQMEDIVL